MKLARPSTYAASRARRYFACIARVACLCTLEATTGSRAIGRWATPWNNGLRGGVAEERKTPPPGQPRRRGGGEPLGDLVDGHPPLDTHLPRLRSQIGRVG